MKAAVALLLTFTLVAAAQAPEEQKGRISGRTLADGGAPLPGVVVNVQGIGPGGVSRQMLSGRDGRFGFADLPSGQYALNYIKTGWTQRPTDIRRYQLPPGGRLEVEASFWRHAVITGRVLDSDGQPAPGVGVRGVRKRFDRRGVRWETRYWALTDDRGVYRIHDLQPGRYLVMAIPQCRSIRPGRTVCTHALTFYPQAGSLDAAVAIEADWGREVAGIDIRLVPGAKTVASGAPPTVGTGCHGCEVSVLRRDDRMYDDVASAHTDQRGRYEVHGLTPGKYHVALFGRSETNIHPGEGSLEIRDEGGYEVVLQPLPPVSTLSGRIAWEDPPELSAEALRRARGMIRLHAADWPGADRGYAQVAFGATSFTTTEVPPGVYDIEVRPFGGGYLRAVSLRGVELERPELDLAADQPPQDLRLHIAFDTATVRGRVRPAGAARVILLPDLERGGYEVEQGTRALEDGSFSIPGAPPGRYYLLAVPDASTFDYHDPDVFEALRRRMSRMTLAPGKTTEVELELITKDRR